MRSAAVVLFALGLGLVAFAAVGEEGVTVSGRITDQDGKPVPGVTVVLETQGGASALRLEALSDGEGRYQFDLPEAYRAYAFTLEKTGYARQRWNHRLGEERFAQRLPVKRDFVLYPEGAGGFGRESKGVRQMPRSFGGQGSFNAGRKAYLSGDYPRARELFEKALVENPDFSPVHEALASVYSQLELYAEAEIFASRVLEERPSDAIALRILYDVYRGQGKRQEARQVLEVLVRVDASPGTGRLLYNDGVAAAKKRDWEQAAALFEAALRLDPSLSRATLDLAKVLVEARSFEEAAEAAERVLAEHPGDVVALRIRHRAYVGAGERQKALAALDELARHSRSRDTAQLLANEGVLAFNRGDDEGALPYFERAAEMATDLVVAQEGLAEIYLRRGEYERAREAARRVLAKEPGHAGAQQILEAALEALEESP